MSVCAKWGEGGASGLGHGEMILGQRVRFSGHSNSRCMCVCLMRDYLSSLIFNVYLAVLVTNSN